jgi:hypothetical protein
MHKKRSLKSRSSSVSWGMMVILSIARGAETRSFLKKEKSTIGKKMIKAGYSLGRRQNTWLDTELDAYVG